MLPQPISNALPRITIFAESGPLAGDLAACLSGRFKIERVTSPQGALISLASGCQAMLILRDAQEEFEPARVEVIKKAVTSRCRVLLLGPGGLGLEQDLDAQVIHLPPLPSLPELFATLSGLGPDLQSNAS